MRKFLILVGLIIVSIAAITIYFVYFYSPKPTYLTNTTELYNLFTPLMESEVDRHLSLIDCDAEKYYYDDSVVCFICNQMDACFKYAWVRRAGGEKMNPKGIPYLTNYEKFSVKVADFYNDGLASVFECVEKDEKTLECKNGVTFTAEGLSVRMSLTNAGEFENASTKICSYYGNTSIECKNSTCSCDKKVIDLKDGLIEISTVV